MLTKYIKVIIIAIILGSCQNTIDATKNKKKLEVSSTSEIYTTEPIYKISFVPNNVASWLGHLIMIDKTGSIFRASATDRTAKLVAAGSYMDVIGTSLKNKSGLFFAINNQGVIEAFIETTNTGDFTFLENISEPDGFIKFCKSTGSDNKIIAIKNNGKFFQIIYNINEKDRSLITSETEIVSPVSSCLTSKGLNLLGEYDLTLNDKLLEINGNKNDSITLKISDGLSIRGTNYPSGVYLTNQNMGSVFNKGLIAVTLEKESRVILLSLKYFENKVLELIKPS
ncbi:MAG: hypothetical protein P8L81_04765 [Hellea sp.]|nr:hypothetical protein [Hellea sp.]